LTLFILHVQTFNAFIKKYTKDCVITNQDPWMT